MRRSPFRMSVVASTSNMAMYSLRRSHMTSTSSTLRLAHPGDQREVRRLMRVRRGADPVAVASIVARDVGVEPHRASNPQELGLNPHVWAVTVLVEAVLERRLVGIRRE